MKENALPHARGTCNYSHACSNPQLQDDQGIKSPKRVGRHRYPNIQGTTLFLLFLSSILFCFVDYV